MPIDVVAAAVVEGRRLLLVSKRQAPDIFYLPGGKRDAGEDDLACLHRELDEELGVTAVDPVPWREVVAPAALEEPARSFPIDGSRLDRLCCVGDPACGA